MREPLAYVLGAWIKWHLASSRIVPIRFSQESTTERYTPVQTNSALDAASATRLEALAVDDRRARLVVLLLGDPHLLEGRERREDRAADPHAVFALRGRDDLHLHRGGRERGDLLGHAVGDARVHGGAAREHDVGVQVLADVDVALHDRVVGPC